MPYLVLLGDSIFDDGRYANHSPDVVSQARDTGASKAAQRTMIFA